MVMIRRSELIDGAMTTHLSSEQNSSEQASLEQESDTDNRRSDGDRREEDRRRSAQGLFELRARRDRIVEDRRRAKRRTEPRFRLAFWRRTSA